MMNGRTTTQQFHLCCVCCNGGDRAKKTGAIARLVWPQEENVCVCVNEEKNYECVNEYLCV